MANIEFPEVKDRDPNSEIDMDVLNDTIEYIRPAVQADGGDIKSVSYTHLTLPTRNCV